jgi:hypothetical protein
MGNQVYHFNCKFYDVDEHTTVVQRIWKIPIIQFKRHINPFIPNRPTDGYWQPIMPGKHT